MFGSGMPPSPANMASSRAYPDERSCLSGPAPQLPPSRPIAIRGGRSARGRPTGPRRYWIASFSIPGQWWVGYHRAKSLVSRWPGGLMPLVLPAQAISRAWLKMEEALRWAELPIPQGAHWAEIGSAPGGSSQALVQRGYSRHWRRSGRDGCGRGESSAVYPSSLPCTAGAAAGVSQDSLAGGRHECRPQLYTRRGGINRQPRGREYSRNVINLETSAMEPCRKYSRIVSTAFEAGDTTLFEPANCNPIAANFAWLRCKNRFDESRSRNREALADSRGNTDCKSEPIPLEFDLFPRWHPVQSKIRQPGLASPILTRVCRRMGRSQAFPTNKRA